MSSTGPSSSPTEILTRLLALFRRKGSISCQGPVAIWPHTLIGPRFPEIHAGVSWGPRVIPHPSPHRPLSPSPRPPQIPPWPQGSKNKVHAFSFHAK